MAKKKKGKTVIQLFGWGHYIAYRFITGKEFKQYTTHGVDLDNFNDSDCQRFYAGPSLDTCLLLIDNEVDCENYDQLTSKYSVTTNALDLVRFPPRKKNCAILYEEYKGIWISIVITESFDPLKLQFQLKVHSFDDEIEDTWLEMTYDGPANEEERDLNSKNEVVYILTNGAEVIEVDTYIDD